jgi:hypothetical protein
MKQGDGKNTGKKSLIICILSAFLIGVSLSAIAAQNVTISVPGIASTSIGLGGGLSVNATLQALATQNVTLAWNPSVSPNIVGYDIYYGGVSGIYTNEIIAGNVTNITVPSLLGGTTYYFVVTAVNSSGIQSSFSSQLPYTLSMAPAVGLPVFSTSGFSFTVTGASGSNCVIQVSTNLINWVPLETNAVPFQFTDSNANHFSRRFYRAVYP